MANDMAHAISGTRNTLIVRSPAFHGQWICICSSPLRGSWCAATHGCDAWSCKTPQPRCIAAVYPPLWQLCKTPSKHQHLLLSKLQITGANQICRSNVPIKHADQMWQSNMPISKDSCNMLLQRRVGLAGTAHTPDSDITRYSLCRAVEQGLLPVAYPFNPPTIWHMSLFVL